MSDKISSEQKELCQKILNHLQNNRYQEKVQYFIQPIKSFFDLNSELGRSFWDEYCSVIQEPKDLSTIEEKLQKNEYQSIASFHKDVKLCFNNAKIYNGSRNPHIAKAADVMLKVFQKEVKAAFEKPPVGVKSVAKKGLKLTLNAPKSSEKIIPKEKKANMVSSSNVSIVNSSARFDATVARNIMKVLNNLKASNWFRVPIDIAQDYYLDRIAVPMDFLKIEDKILHNEYSTMEEYARDVRRCFGNPLVYNHNVMHPNLDSKKYIQNIRRDSKVMLFRFEDEWSKHMGSRGVSPSLPELKDMLAAIEESLRVMSSTFDGVSAIEAFMCSIAFYFPNDPETVAEYNSIVSKPMNYGNILSMLIEAQYTATEDVLKDCELVAKNCATYYSKKNNVSLSVAKKEDALSIDAFNVFNKITVELEKLRGKRTVPIPDRVQDVHVDSTTTSVPVQSSKAVAEISGTDDKTHFAPEIKSSIEPITPVKKAPPYNVKAKYLWCLEELKAHKTKDNIQTVWPFLNAVDVKIYTDYFQAVSHAMDLSLMQKHINRDRYPDMMALWSDMDLIRKNCHAYAAFKGGFPDIEILADLSANVFRYLLKIVAQEIEALGTGDGSLYNSILPTDEAREIIMNAPAQPDLEQFYNERFLKLRLAEEQGADVSVATTEKSRQKQKPIAVVTNSYSGNLVPSPQSPEYHDEDPMVDFADPYDDYFQPAVVPTSSKRVAVKGSATKKAGNSQSFASPAPASGTVVTESGALEFESWELACYDLLKKLCKHEFIDTTKAVKAGVVVVNFFHPVVDLFPTIRDKYLSVISQPMDFAMIYNRLDMRGYLDAEDLFQKILLIFQNCIEYNSPAIPEDDGVRFIVMRCKHMIKYVKWLAHEILPLIDDTTKNNEKEREAMGTLRLTLQDVYRQDRLDVIDNYPILNGGRECFALIKKFEIRKYNKELSYFIYPVEVSALADYSIHIRHPMCFQVLKEKLENSVMDMSHSEVGASGNCYTTYGQFLKDLGLIFKNAKTYCALHMEVDEVSRNIYDAAIMFNDLMAEWIAKDFSLEVAEKVGLHAIKSEELSLAEAKAAEERRLLEEADEKYRQEQLELLYKQDPAFAADQLSRQASAVAIARTAINTSIGGQSSQISLQDGSDLADVDEMSDLSRKRKRDIGYDDEGDEEDYAENDDDVSEDDGDEEFKVGRSKAKKKKTAPVDHHTVDTVADDEEESLTMDVFAQHDVTEALLKQQEEMLQMRQQGSVAATIDNSIGGKGAGVVITEAGMQQWRAEVRQRTRDAVWASFGKPRARRGKRGRGQSFTDDESDCMSECSDFTSNSTSTTATVTVLTNHDRGNSSSKANNILTTDKTAHINSPLPVREDHNMQTKPFISNIRILKTKQRKNRKTKLISEACEMIFVSPDDEEPREYSFEASSLTTIGPLSSTSNCLPTPNSETVVKLDSVEGAKEKAMICDAITTYEKVENKENVIQSAVAHMTAMAVKFADSQLNGIPQSSHRLRIHKFFDSQTHGAHSVSSCEMYSVKSRSCIDEKVKHELLVDEKIVRINYSLQSGADLVQLLIPFSLLRNEATDYNQQCVQSENSNSESVYNPAYIIPPLQSSSISGNLDKGMGSAGADIGTGNLNPAQLQSVITLGPPLLASSSSMTLMTSMADPLQTLPLGAQSTVHSHLSQNQMPQLQQQFSSHHMYQHQSQDIPPVFQQQPQLASEQFNNQQLGSSHPKVDLRVQTIPDSRNHSQGGSSSSTSTLSPRGRSMSGSSPTSRSRRRRSGSLSCQSPTSRERERCLRRNLNLVDEILKFVSCVDKRNFEYSIASHPLMLTFKHHLKKDNKVPLISGKRNNCKANIKPMLVRKNGNAKSRCVSVGYRNDIVKLLLHSGATTGGLNRGHVCDYIQRSQVSSFCVFRDGFFSNVSPSSDTSFEVHSVDSDIYRMRACLPGGPKINTPMVAVAGGVLVSQVAERVTLQIPSLHNEVTGMEDDLVKHHDDVDYEVDYLQLWVLADKKEALIMDLKVDIPW